MTDTNGTVHVTGYGDVNLRTAANLEDQARRNLKTNRDEAAANTAEIADLEQKIAERKARLRILNVYIASDEKALGETPATTTASRRPRRSQGHTEANPVAVA